jgi:glycosyltransferase involved in cell wall biosynthesis
VTGTLEADMSKRIVIVVPCFNEARRLDPREFLRLSASRQELALLFVDDGSRDATPDVLAGLRASGAGAIQVLRLPRNEGKAEAVRQGLRAAIRGGALVVGFVDADLSTPVDEVLRLVDLVEDIPEDVILGARVRLLGSRIERPAFRYWVGRVFARVAALVLGVPVYDTQCGAKLFRVSPTLQSALEARFHARWAFDVELLARLLAGSAQAPPLEVARFREVPLQAWRDVKGSKLRLAHMCRAALELAGMYVRLRLRRRFAFRPNTGRGAAAALGKEHRDGSLGPVGSAPPPGRAARTGTLE